MARHAPSTAARIDKAFKELCTLRSKFGFPEVQSVDEMQGEWHIIYGMPHAVVLQVQTSVQLITQYLGKISWEHAPSKL